MIIKKPIFIISVGRSGSSIFYKMFSEHPNVAWLSYLCDKYPDQPSIVRLRLAAIDYPVVGRWVRKRFQPGEGYDFWEYYCKGFSEPCRDLVAQDVTIKVKETIPKIMSQILTPRRHRLLIKITGWPRVGFLLEIFEDAKFIYIKRDEGAVINSMLNVFFWRGWQGPQNWRWGELTPTQKEEWERFDRSFIALAGIEMKILAEAIQKAKGLLNDDNFLELTYENLCADPVGVFEKVIRFCELPWSPNFENSIKTYSLKNTNYKWRQELTLEQQKIAEHFVNACRT